MTGFNHSPSVWVFFKRLLTKKLAQAYYRARESIGDPKREIVVHQVGQACISLQGTRDEFANALQRLDHLATVQEMSLEQRYYHLNRHYQCCRTKSESLSARINAIEEVTEALFVEWEKELAEYSNRTLRNTSKQQLKIAKQHYTRLIKAMRKAESRIQPVLAAFKDQVLYLKHHLNAKAIAELRHEFQGISLDISDLIVAMEQIITEANQFVSVLGLRDDNKTKTLPSR